MKRLFFALVLLFLSGAFVVSLPAKASTDSLWVNEGSLNIDIGEQSSKTTEIAGQPCFQTVFKIKRFTSGGTQNGQTVWRPAPNQEVQVCAVQSGVGLIAYHSGGTYIQFPGSTYAIRIHSAARNFVVTVIPVPGSRTTVVQTKTSTSYSPAATHVFYNLLGVGDVTISAGEAIYYIRTFPERFTDQSGNTLDMSNFAFSSNGEWLLTIVRSAVMRINVKTKEMQTIARGFIDGGIQYRMSITGDGRYAFVQSYHQGFGNPVIYDLNDCQPNQQYNYGQVPQIVPGCGARQLRNDILSKVPGFLLFEQMRFGYDAQTLSGFVSFREQSSGPVIKKRVMILRSDYVKPSLEYLALGDSFSSGEGDTEGGTWYEPGTDDSNNKCHLSRRSYPYLVAEQLGLHEGPNKTPSGDSLFHSVACSGASSVHLTTKAQHGKDNAGWLSGSIPQTTWIRQGRPKSATISIIGNDIGFSNKIRRCIGPDTCFNTYEERLEILQEIQSKFDLLVSLYNNLKEASPEVRLYALGYPQLINPQGDCAANVRLDQTEGQMANDLVKFLNDTIEAAAKKAGVMYIDVESAFSGRRLCDGKPQFLAVNGLTAGNDLLFRLVGNESYHPNSIGHQRFAEKLNQQSNNLIAAMPIPDPAAKAPDPFEEQYAGFFQDFMHRERQAYSLINDDELAEDVIVALLEQEMEVEVPGGGEYALWINSEPVYLGSFTPDENGILHLNYTIPNTVEPGFHTLHLFGKNASGDNVDIYKTVFVAGSETDYDGDGLPNNQDSCPMISPTGIDEDKDGIDDACDNLIDDPPVEATVREENIKPPVKNPETVAGNESLAFENSNTLSGPSVSHNTSNPSAPQTISRQTQPSTDENSSGVLVSVSEKQELPSLSSEAQIDASTSANSAPAPKLPILWIGIGAFGLLAAVATLIFRPYSRS